MSNNNSQNLKKIQHKIYALANKSFGGIFRDDAWQNVGRFKEAIESIEGVDEVLLSAGKYYNYLQSGSNNTAPYRDYETTVCTPYGNLEGYIRCCAAGTVEDPFDRYDIVISLYPVKEEKLFEGKKMTITESELKAMITKAINEEIGNISVFSKDIQECNNLAIIGEEAIERINDKVELLENIEQVLTSIDGEIKQTFQGIEGPIKKGYQYEYRFNQPLVYNEETDSYGTMSGEMEYLFDDMIPQAYKDFISLHYNYGNNNSIEAIYGINMTLEFEDIFSDILK